MKPQGHQSSCSKRPVLAQMRRARSARISGRLLVAQRHQNSRAQNQRANAVQPGNDLTGHDLAGGKGCDATSPQSARRRRGPAGSQGSSQPRGRPRQDLNSPAAIRLGATSTGRSILGPPVSPPRLSSPRQNRPACRSRPSPSGLPSHYRTTGSSSPSRGLRSELRSNESQSHIVKGAGRWERLHDLWGWMCMRRRSR